MKKKAIKIATSTAIAASAFVAAAPTQAASNVDAQVKAAVDAGTVLKWAISIEGTGDGATRPWDAYNDAKAKLATAEAAIAGLTAAEKAVAEAKLEGTKTQITRAMAYIDAITAGEKITTARLALEAAITSGNLNAVETAYHGMTAEARKQNALLDRVYGQSTRDLIRTNYKVAAEKVQASVMYDVTVKMALDKAEGFVTASNFDKAQDYLAEAKKYLDKVSATFKTQLTTKVATVEATITPMVTSVTHTDATRVVINFTKPVSKASLFADGVSGAFKQTNSVPAVTFTTIDGVASGTLTGSLSADGKTLTVTSQYALANRYDVAVKNLTTTTGEAVVNYVKVASFTADRTAPSVVATEKPTAGTVRVTFSEPMNSLGTVSFKLANGTVVSSGGNGVSNDFTTGARVVTFTLGSDVPANSTVTATFVGAQDRAGNLITPNPSTVSLFKGSSDGVAPTVASVTQLDATRFAVKFSEELQTTPVVTVNNVGATVQQDSADSTTFIVTSNTPLDGVSNVYISNFTDLSGVAGTAVNRVITFVKDSAAPKVVSSAVVADSATGKEYLEITFDKDVNISMATVDATSGSYVKDFITTPVLDSDITATSIAYKTASNKKVLRVELDTFLGTTFDVRGAVYNLNLAFAGVQSTAQINATTASVSFTRGVDGSAANTNLVVVNTVLAGSDNNKVNVTFDREVDGASATNPANYQIDGAIVESVTLNPASGGTQVAVLNLRAGSNGFTGVRNYTISGVKALGSSKVMNVKYGTVSLNENLAPTVTSARLTATNQVTLTFSEAITNASQDTNDFELYIGGVKVAANDQVTTAAGSGVTSLVLTLEDNVTAANLTSGLTLKALNTLNIEDAAGNKVSVGTAGIVVSQ